MGVSVNARLQVGVLDEDGEFVADEVGPRHGCPEGPAAASGARTTDSRSARWLTRLILMPSSRLLWLMPL